MIALTCPHCNHPFSVSDFIAGFTTVCPACKSAIEVPSPGMPADKPSVENADPPAPPPDDPYATGSSLPPETHGTRYRIVRPHAKGGLGVVSVAHDGELHREVALKEIQEHCADDNESRSRFLVEAEITGRLEHPGVVPVYGLGHYPDGRPFYAMRLIKGDSLKEVIARFHGNEPRASASGERTLELRQLLTRFIAVCQTIQYAHDRGVLHRDIKPSNIMLGKYGETLVVDWGIAKVIGRPERTGAPSQLDDEPTLRPKSAVGSSVETVAGSAVGTPQYMSPEQAAGRLDLLSAASDVYSLGGTLYCLVTGESPVPEGDISEMLRKVQKGDIPRPRMFKPNLDRALEAICMKAMALQPADRYATPLTLAADLERWLADEPVVAWPEPWTVKTRRWVGRYRTLMTGTTAALLVGMISLAIAAGLLSSANEANKLLAEKATKASDAAEDRRKEAVQHAEENKSLAEKATAAGMVAEDRRKEAVQHAEENKSLAEKATKAHKEAEALAKKNKDLADSERMARKEMDRRREQAEEAALRVRVGHFFHRASEDPAIALTSVPLFLPDASKRQDATLANSMRLHLASWGEQVNQLRWVAAHQNGINAVALSENGRRVITGGQDGVARLWDAATGRWLGNLHHGDIVWAVALSADGQIALTGSGDKTARLWNMTTGKPRLIGEPLQHEDWVMSVALSADGKIAITGSRDKTARLWNAATGTPLGPALQHQGPVRVAITTDGVLALTGSEDKTACLWETASGKKIATLDHPYAVHSVVFSADAKTAATTCHDSKAKISEARIWNAVTGKPMTPSLPHENSFLHIALSADGKVALTGGQNKTAQLWNALTGKPTGPPLLHAAMIRSIALSADGSVALTGSGNSVWGRSEARLWDTTIGKAVGSPLLHMGVVYAVALSADGKAAVTGGFDNTVRFWDTALARSVWPSLQPDGWVNDLALSADGKTALTGWQVLKGQPGTIAAAQLWTTNTGERIGPGLHQGGVVRVCLSADGKVALTTGKFDDTVRLWDTATGKPLGPPMKHQGEISSAALSADGNIALTTAGKRALIWNVSTGKAIAEPIPLDGMVSAATLSADGKTALTGCEDGTARLWDTATSKQIGAPLIFHLSWVNSVALSADGRVALTGSRDFTAQLWNSATGKPIGKPLRHQHPLMAVALSADGKVALTGSEDMTARLWDTATGNPLGPPLEHQFWVGHVALSADGKIALTGCQDTTARLWETATGKPVGSPLRHPEAVRALALSSNGAIALTTDGRTTRLRKVPKPVVAEPERILLWAQVITGIECDEQGTVRILDAAAWRLRRQLLHLLGGPPGEGLPMKASTVQDKSFKGLNETDLKMVLEHLSVNWHPTKIRGFSDGMESRYDITWESGNPGYYIYTAVSAGQLANLKQERAKEGYIVTAESTWNVDGRDVYAAIFRAR